jgi:uncharacterized lipoprotein YajG
MKNNTKILAALLLSTTFYLSGCSTHSNFATFEQHRPLKTMSSIIKKAAIEDGWRVTDFKENALIAEKFNTNNSKAVTIKFSNDSFSLEPYDDDLYDTLENALHKSSQE